MSRYFITFGELAFIGFEDNEARFAVMDSPGWGSKVKVYDNAISVWHDKQILGFGRVKFARNFKEIGGEIDVQRTH
ncbi:hypothetical protein [Halolactibacillus halophilus]|nr:hypothetical protein [Halolactibacillus halophilus]